MFEKKIEANKFEIFLLFIFYFVVISWFHASLFFWKALFRFPIRKIATLYLIECNTSKNFGLWV